MNDESALVPVEQKEVQFYGDTIIAVRVGGEEQVFVPVRPSSCGQKDDLKKQVNGSKRYE